MLDKIRIVLVRTSHPRNIGASARSLKTMGLSKLYLVSPKVFPSEEANNLASHALDVLKAATVVPTLSQALTSCQCVFATSSRKRFIEWPSLTPREAAQKIKRVIETQPQTTVAIVFGNEKHGLTNEELETSHYQISIPTHEQYTSLNLAQAVQLIAYELYLAFKEEGEERTERPAPCADKVFIDPEDPLANAEDLARFYEALEKTLVDIQFLKPERSLYLMPRLKRLFSRANLSGSEVNLLRGILTAIRKRV